MERLNFSGKNVNRTCKINGKGQSKITPENDKKFTNQQRCSQ